MWPTLSSDLRTTTVISDAKTVFVAIQPAHTRPGISLR